MGARRLRLPDEQRLYQRQRGLIQLAKAGAADLGRRIRLEGIDAGSNCRSARATTSSRMYTLGHTVQFAHDIFFEWSFLHLLMDRGRGMAR